jgi:hypothetical protein
VLLQETEKLRGFLFLFSFDPFLFLIWFSQGQKEIASVLAALQKEKVSQTISFSIFQIDREGEKSIRSEWTEC